MTTIFTKINEFLLVMVRW